MNRTTLSRIFVTIFVILIIVSFSSCNNDKIKKAVDGLLPTKSELIELGKISKTQINLISGEKAYNILSTKDSYIDNLSEFDFAAKFKSETKLDYDKIVNAYKGVTLDWNIEQKEKLEYVIEELNSYFKNRTFNLPETINVIKTNGQIEAGAAYTRANAIVFSNHLIESKSINELKTLFTHELFHIYTYNNKDKIDSLYEIIGFKKCNELKLPENLASRILSNPDAPLNTHYITCKYKDKDVNFMPILYSQKQYDLDSALTFFSYVSDDMIAVELKNDVPEPIYENNKPLIVKKEDIQNFYELIGNNTTYTYHPEEILAENFVLLVQGGEISNRTIVDKLSKIVFAKK